MLEAHSAAPRASLTLPSCSPNYPRASQGVGTSRIGWTHARHCPFINFQAARTSNKRTKSGRAKEHAWGEPKEWGEVERGWVRRRRGWGGKCLFCQSFAVFLPFASVWKRKGNGCYTGYSLTEQHLSNRSFHKYQFSNISFARGGRFHLSLNKAEQTNWVFLILNY